MKTYQETVEWMFQQLPMYQQVGKKAYRADLGNILKLCAHLGNPHKDFKSIHVGGTNGKGSVTHMLASILQESGNKVGLYTSPHLVDYRERIRINGELIPEQYVTDFIEDQKAVLDQGGFSFFEMSVGLAFSYFASQSVDIAVVEVGLGGRLDSTNIIQPELSIITNIGYDHTQVLGTTLEAIAGEKAGIIKEKTPVVIGEFSSETLPVFRMAASKNNAPIYFAENQEFPERTAQLKGAYQKKNIRTVQMAVKILKELGWKITENSLERGLQKVITNTGLRGRWEILQKSPKVICDTAHNAEGLRYTMEQLRREEGKKRYLVIGVVNDKDLDNILPLFPREATYYFARPNVPRGLDAEILQEKAGEFGLNGMVYPSVKIAYQAAVEDAGEEDLIYVGGSTFTVAEII